MNYRAGKWVFPPDFVHCCKDEHSTVILGQVSQSGACPAQSNKNYYYYQVFTKKTWPQSEELEKGAHF